MSKRGIWLLVFLAGCAGDAIREEGDPDSDGGTIMIADEDGGASTSTMLAAGGQARVIADSLNLRDGAGTQAMILTAMPCGATVDVLGGPSTAPSAGWWNITYTAAGGASAPVTGWASGKYLVAAAQFSDAQCGGGSGTPPPANTADIFDRAKSAVGFSYYWGHGSWSLDKSAPGSCTGSCPSCSHVGQWGADCSGFVAKAWQVPKPSPIETDAHPFSTANFYSEQVYWKQTPRSGLQPADALVRRANGAGHIALVESTSDPFGDVWAYEARGCATGVVHNLRAFDSSYIAIRRNGL